MPALVESAGDDRGKPGHDERGLFCLHNAFAHATITAHSLAAPPCLEIRGSSPRMTKTGVDHDCIAGGRFPSAQAEERQDRDDDDDHADDDEDVGHS
ncbi:hypothetical protein JL101_024025 [Skermanella rosea]|uniref:hypothetical protein n=1 Tax=Skermanella rosea TaxID=1817965 RepID=UPI0019330D59|nr:hypothetical protein [Skermanella rosea]UEM03006.1 hypothetical protein JL101_024025 [Skermanella rosea]